MIERFSHLDRWTIDSFPVGEKVTLVGGEVKFALLDSDSWAKVTHCIDLSTYGTAWDVRVDFTSYHSNDTVGFNKIFRTGLWLGSGAERMYYQHSFNAHKLYYILSGGGSVVLTERPKKLRIKRDGSIVYMYYMHNSIWHLVTSHDFTGVEENIGVDIMLQANTGPGATGGYCTFDNLADKHILPTTTTTTSTASTSSSTKSTTSTMSTSSTLSTTTTTGLPSAQDEYFNDLDDWTIYKQDGTEHVEIQSNELHLEVELAKDSLITMYHQMMLPVSNTQYTIDITDYYALVTTAGGRIALVGVSNDLQDQVYIEFRQDSGQSPQWRGLTKHRIDGSWTSPADTFSTATMPSKLKVRRTGTDMELSYYDGSWHVVTLVDFSTRVNNIRKAGLSFDDSAFSLSWVNLDNLDYT